MKIKMKKMEGMGNMKDDCSYKPKNEKLCKKLRDTEKEINKRQMLSSCFYRDDNESVLVSGSNISSKRSGTSTSGCYSMLPSARERIENQHHFRNSYSYLCEINNSIPKIKVQQDQVLEFYGDRIRFDDWVPIIKAIENDQSLRVIKIKNRNLSQQDFISRDPAIYKRKILNLLVVALQKCLTDSKILSIIHLESLPFSISNIKILFNGIEKNSNIQSIELPCCSVGNKGCDMLCRVLRYKSNVKSLDLTSCGITTDGAIYISELIQVQKLIRYGDCWKQSLRYRQPNPSTSNGLQRIILNNNINLGDSGFSCIVDSLLDDLWITEIHCQNCGLTNDSAEKAINLAKGNYFIKYIDIRRNLLVDSDLVIALEKLLNVNNASVPYQKAWRSSGPDLYEPNHKVSKDCNKLKKLKSVSGLSCPSTGDSVSSTKCSRNSHSSVSISVPPLRISHSQTNQASRKPAVAKQKLSDLQLTERNLREAKSKLVKEISIRVATENYCRQLEIQLKEREKYVLIEKSLLKKLIQTFQEFSHSLIEIAKTENRFINKLEVENNIIHSFKIENLTYEADDLKKNKNREKRLSTEYKERHQSTENFGKNSLPVQSQNNLAKNSNYINDPKTRAIELFNELLKKSSKCNMLDIKKVV